ncbi:MAG: Zn-dependent metalloprotease [Phenylobacterium sp.]|jgi:Zn-dependent metalloprotease
MRILSPLAATIAIALSSTTMMANAAIAVQANHNAQGQATFVKGQLGTTSSANTITALKSILSSQPGYEAVGNEDFAVKRQWIDKLGKRHTHLNQRINGLNVYGTSMIVHANISNVKGANSALKNNKDQDNANIYAISGTLATDDTLTNLQAVVLKSKTAKSTANQAIHLAANIGDVTGEAELAYVFLPEAGETKLAWRIDVSWDNGDEDFGHDIVFYDYHNNELLTRHPQIHAAKNWQTHSLDNQGRSAAPGRLLCTNEESCGDDSGTRAHDGASGVYDYYKQTFGRNGINDADMTMVSSVHLDRNLNNAYWTGTQMMYGDGDGQILGDLTMSYEVIGHELTHGVTQHTAGLIYRNASGALNEAWSDILGAAAKAHHNGSEQPDWLLAKESFTPTKDGDAMRYMDNPTKDNYSKDWFPDHIPWGGSDNGGVHGNSGIANLAFVLLVDGGSHPSGKSEQLVTKLGLAKTEQIFYRALNTYMNQNTNFEGAQTATAQAAEDLYGIAEKDAVMEAWCAVGVGLNTPACGDVVYPDCDDAAWDPATVYTAGDRASRHGKIYEAKWWTRGADPTQAPNEWYVWFEVAVCEAP